MDIKAEYVRDNSSCSGGYRQMGNLRLADLQGLGCYIKKNLIFFFLLKNKCIGLGR